MTMNDLTALCYMAKAAGLTPKDLQEQVKKKGIKSGEELLKWVEIFYDNTRAMRLFRSIRKDNGR